MTTHSYSYRRAGNGCGRLPTLRCLLVATVLVAFAVATPVLPVGAQTGDYPDVDQGNVHAPSIDALASDSRNILAGTGCGEGRFCPDDPLPRWVMAVWLVRALDGKDPAPSGVSSYTDVDSAQWWVTYTNRLGQLGVTRGCGVDPPRYCPDRPVTRAEMATFWPGRSTYLTQRRAGSPTPSATSTRRASTSSPSGASPPAAVLTRPATAPTGR